MPCPGIFGPRLIDSPRPLPTPSPIERLRALPRVSLVGPSTPVLRLERFEKAIGSPYPILIKRDDAIPFGFGGNKVRKLELVIAEALASRARGIVTCGGFQSNHCRATAAAAARFGLVCHLVLNGERPKILAGNARLAELFGASLHFVKSREDREPTMTALAASLSAGGLKTTVIPLGASTALGAAGLALGALEMLEQDIRPDIIVHASSSGGTQAGLIAGLTLAGAQARVIGISADETASALQGVVAGLGRGLLELAGSPASLPDPEVWDGFIGGGYGVATDGSKEGARLLARSEAIVVDHTYTAKALAGLIHGVRTRAFPEGSSILFWHTGGQVGVLA